MSYLFPGKNQKRAHEAEETAHAKDWKQTLMQIKVQVSDWGLMNSATEKASYFQVKKGLEGSKMFH